MWSLSLNGINHVGTFLYFICKTLLCFDIDNIEYTITGFIYLHKAAYILVTTAGMDQLLSVLLAHLSLL